jgi:FtsH-binding integral membrane protein
MSVWTEKSTAIPVAEAKTVDRLTFIKKVYNLLSLSLLTGILAGVFTLNNEGLLLLVAKNQLLFFIAEIAVVVLCMWKRKHATLSFVFLFAFTTLTGLTTAPIVAVYQSVAFPAAVLTMVAFGSLTAYAMITKKDFSFLRGALFVGLILLIVGGLLNVFFFKSFDLQYFMAWGGAFLFSGFILYDTSNIIHRYKTDEVVLGALSLYLDILNLFLSILVILGGRRS